MSTAAPWWSASSSPRIVGRATDAALRAVADALSISRRAVTLVRGTTGRRKVVDIEVTHSLGEPLEAAWRRLLDRSAGD